MQDYFSLVHAVLSYVESHLGTKLSPAELEQEMRVSYPHLRDVLRRNTSIPLARYILDRRVASAAFDLVHTKRSILDIAESLGFQNPDTFTRSFRRVTGQNPSSFRNAGVRVGRKRIAVGIFGPAILSSSHPNKTDTTEEFMMEKEMKKEIDSCILYGVRKVNYCYEEATPFPACLRSVLNYMGQEIDYCYLMAATGAAFRLRWNREYWDGGNVDICVIYDNAEEAFVRAFEAAGRSHTMLRREGSTKEDFIKFIRREIDEGRPVIALGIIGPPEACIVTGYKDGGQTLLGWNFFQEMGEFAGAHSIDPSGYFVTDAWWENSNTTLLMAVGEKEDRRIAKEEILRNALWIMRTESVGPFAGGQAAYDLWAQRIADDREFADTLPKPQLFDRLMCQNDALTMTTEGRAYAGYYLRYVASEYQKDGDEAKASLANKAADTFFTEFHTAQKIGEVHGGEGEEEVIRALFAKENRGKIVDLIKKMSVLDIMAADMIDDLLA